MEDLDSTEKDLFKIIIHLISSSRLLIDEPKEYGPMRLLTAASYLSQFLENHTNFKEKKLLKSIQNIDILVSRNLFDKPEKLKSTLDELSKNLAKFLKKNE